MKLKRKQRIFLLRVLAPLAIVVLWLGLSGIGGPYFGRIDEVSTNDLTNFLPQSADSTKVNERSGAFRDESTIPLIYVFTNDANAAVTVEQQAQVADFVTNVQGVYGISGTVSPPVPSEDGKALLVTIPLSSDVEFADSIAVTKEIAGSAATDINYVISGPAAFTKDIQDAFAGIDGVLLVVALSVVLVILLAVYRSPFLPIVTLVGALAALSTAVLIVWHLADAGVLQLNGQVQGILFILVIGATTDYSLLYISRYREELLRRENAWKATKVAWKASLEPIAAAGGTVIAGLMCLLFSDLGSNQSLGPVAGIGIMLAILAALTYLPATLLALGRTAFWPGKIHYVGNKSRHDYRTEHPLWNRVGTFVRNHPRRIWIVTLVMLLGAAAFLPQLRAEGVSQSDLILGYSEAREGQKVLNQHFPSGSGSPAFVLASSATQSKVVQYLDDTTGVEGVSVVANNSRSGTMPLGDGAAQIRSEIQKNIAAKRGESGFPPLRTLVDRAYPFSNATPKVVNGDVLYQVTLVDAADSIEARNTIKDLRAGITDVDPGALVGGVTAAQLDTNNASLRDQRVIIPLILIAITVILMGLLRSIVAPLVLLLTTVLSFAATLGISALLFNDILGFPGADPSVVIFGFVFLVALGIDYNIFLMSRVREETVALGIKGGTIKGLVVTGGVITSAGIVLAATFSALAVLPILFLAQLAFVVGFGVLLDTLIVRSLLVPALTLEIGRLMWWPSKLSKEDNKN